MARITVEDCLQKVPSRFMLVHIASQRARELMKGATPFVKTDNKYVVTALREVAAGIVELAEETKSSKKGELHQ
ncbi:MAG: DNA-directed RNA polymerase subunit omega [Deltaproteobacteria bacterium]|nr:DNA-directed RNA polymerase subunit omega [Deltaproteobacteria bacterium]